MDIVNKAFAELYHEVPERIINIFFAPKYHSNLRVRSVDAVIEELIFKKKIVSDCSLYGGKIKEIILTEDMVETTGSSGLSAAMSGHIYATYRIPPQVRDDLPIVGVHNVKAYMPYSIAPNDHAFISQEPMMNLDHAANRMLNALTGGTGRPTPIPEILDDNLIRLNPIVRNATTWVLEARLGYDDRMSNLNTEATIAFFGMFIEAVKTYIYVNGRIVAEEAALKQGVTLDSVKDYIENDCRESSQRYKEYREEFIGAAQLDKRRFIRALEARI